MGHYTNPKYVLKTKMTTWVRRQCGDWVKICVSVRVCVCGRRNSGRDKKLEVLHHRKGLSLYATGH